MNDTRATQLQLKSMSFISNKYMGDILLHGLLVLLFLVTTTSAAGTIIKTLPGYAGDLPFTLETGYINLDNGSVQYFYYFVESQGDPETDPLLLWITGNGCSSLHALLFQNGPLLLQDQAWDDTLNLPILFDNPYSWTKNMSVIFLDAPIGTGFSYSPQGLSYPSSDTLFADRGYHFLRGWFKDHPDFQKNDFYIGGDGYAGINVPMIINNTLSNDDPDALQINLVGYILGNPGADNNTDFNMRIPFANRLGCIPDDLFENTNKFCDGNFISYDSANEVCDLLVKQCEKLIANLNRGHILEASCGGDSQEHPSPSLNSYPQISAYPRRTLYNHNEYAIDVGNAQQTINYTVWCRKTFDAYADTWANDPSVQAALQVHEGRVPLWVGCRVNNTYPYPYGQNVGSVTDLHKQFTTETTQSGRILRVLVYSGDHDLDLPYLGTLKWIKELGVPLAESWRVWSVDNETAGYTMGYEKNNGYKLTFATVLGAGHFASQYKVKECSDMIGKWIAGEPLGQAKDLN